MSSDSNIITDFVRYAPWMPSVGSRGLNVKKDTIATSREMALALFFEEAVLAQFCLVKDALMKLASNFENNMYETIDPSEKVEK